MGLMLLVVLAVLIPGALASSDGKSPVVVTNVYYVSDGGQRAIQLTGQPAKPISVHLGDEFSLVVDWKIAETTKSPCGTRAKEPCRISLEMYKVYGGDGLIRAYGLGDKSAVGPKIRLNRGAGARMVLHHTIPRDEAPIGSSVFIVRWVLFDKESELDRELQRFEVLFTILAR